MQDNFYEQFVPGHENTAYRMANIEMKISMVLGALFLLSTAILGLLGLILCVVCAIMYFAMIVLKRKIYVDYEYEFTNGEIDIVSIGDKIKRKTIITFNIKDVELLAAKDSYEIKDFSNKPDRILKCYPNDTNEKVYTAILNGDGGHAQIEFIPDEEFLNLCFLKNPRAVKKSS